MWCSVFLLFCLSSWVLQSHTMPACPSSYVCPSHWHSNVNNAPNVANNAHHPTWEIPLALPISRKWCYGEGAGIPRHHWDMSIKGAAKSSFKGTHKEKFSVTGMGEGQNEEQEEGRRSGPETRHHQSSPSRHATRHQMPPFEPCCRRRHATYDIDEIVQDDAAIIEVAATTILRHATHDVYFRHQSRAGIHETAKHK